MKSRTMADLLIGDKKFNPNRILTNIEVTAIAVLAGEDPHKTYTMLFSLMEEAAGLPKPMDAVSVISSLMGAVSVVCPKVVFLVSGTRKVSPFFDELLERRIQLECTRATQPSTADDIRRRTQWYWGITVGVFQLLQVPSLEDLRLGGVGVDTFYQSACDIVVPFLISLWRVSSPKEMSSEIFTRTAELLLKFQKEDPAMFNILVRQVCKQKGNAHFPEFGEQIWKELRGRYWHSRSVSEQEKMIG